MSFASQFDSHNFDISSITFDESWPAIDEFTDIFTADNNNPWTFSDNSWNSSRSTVRRGIWEAPISLPTIYLLSTSHPPTAFGSSSLYITIASPCTSFQETDHCGNILLSCLASPHMEQKNFKTTVAAASHLQEVHPSLSLLDLTLGFSENHAVLPLIRSLGSNTTLRSLRLSKYPLSEDGERALAEALQTNSTLTNLTFELNFSVSSIAPPRGLFLDALFNNPTLTSLNLSHNNLYAQGDRIGLALRTNSTLTSLDLSADGLGDMAIFESLQTNTTLTVLNLSHNSIGRIPQAPLSSNAIGAALLLNSTLRSVKLGGNALNDKAMIGESLRTNSTLTFLDLSNNDINGTAIGASLRTNSSLTYLNLSSNSIGPNEISIAIADALKVNSTLTSLNLSSNPIQSDGGISLAESLKLNSALTELDLTCTQVGDPGAAAIGEALRINSTLTSLRLSSNNIGEMGGVRIGEALQSNSTLVSLDLSQSRFANASGLAIAKALHTNSTLTELNLAACRMNPSVGRAIAESLQYNSTLTCVNLNGFPIIGYDTAMSIATAIRTNSTLTSLNISSDGITSRGEIVIAQALAANTTLTSLDMHACGIRGDGIQALGTALMANHTLLCLKLYWLGGRSVVNDAPFIDLDGNVIKNQTLYFKLLSALDYLRF